MADSWPMVAWTAFKYGVDTLLLIVHIAYAVDRVLSYRTIEDLPPSKRRMTYAANRPIRNQVTPQTLRKMRHSSD